MKSPLINLSLALALAALPLNLPAVNGTWTNLAGGSWPVAANWSGGTVAGGVGSTAFFNALNLAANTTVTLDGPQTIGNLQFSDVTAPFTNWIVNPGSGGSLTLAVSSGTPTITITNGQTTINAVLSGTGGLTKTGAGTLLLTATNTFTGTVINNGADSKLAFTTPAAFAGQTIQLGLNPGASQVRFIASGADLTLTNNIELRTARTIIGNDTVGGLAASNQTWTGNVLLNQGAGIARDFFCQRELTISGTVSGGPTGLNLSSGKLTLQGSNTFTNNVTFTGASTLNINSDAALGAAANVINFNITSTLQLATNTTVTLNADRTNNIAAANNAIYDVPAGSTLTVPGVIKYDNSTATNSNLRKDGVGTLILSGGLGGSALNTLNITGGKVSVQGGTWNVPLATDGYFFRVAGGATYEQTGGTMNAPAFAVLGQATAGSSLTSTGIFSGGTFNCPDQFMVGRLNSAVMTVSGSALLSPLYLRLGEQPTYTTTCNLDGGTIACNYVSTRGTNTDHTSILNLNGGTLQARRNDSFFIGGSATAFLTQVNVKSGGAIIDSQGFAITIPQALDHDAGLGATPDGGLTKLGSGTLTLSGDNTYTGPTFVSAGKLVVPSTHADSGGVTVGANASLAVAVSGTSQWQPASLTLANPCTLEFSNLQNPGTTNAPIRPTTPVGAVSGVTINVISIPGAVAGKSYPLLGNQGGTTNGYALGTQPPGVTGSLGVNGTTLVYNVPNGWLSPTPNQNVPMDVAGPLALSWLQVSGSTAYDVFLGTVSNSVATATTNNPLGTYQGRTAALTLNISGLLPNTTYYWRADGVAINGTPTTGTVYSFTTGAAMVDLMEDTWVATDALNRSLPGISETGSPRTNRPVAMFYHLWHGTHSYVAGTNSGVSQYLSAHPYSDPHNPWADNPIMQTIKTTYWWSRPEMDYYKPSDPWVLRRQIALLNHAGVDVLIFDYSNNATYDAELNALCDMIRQMRFEGLKINLKIAFLTHTKSGTMATYLYDTLYGPGKYSDLWLYWQGKPLILGSINGSGGDDIVPSSEVQNFFTWRYSWAWVGGLDTIAWIDSNTPQKFGYHDAADHPESAPVTCGGWATLGLGRSFVNHAEPDYNSYHLPVTGTEDKGLFFKEQMHYGLKYDPQLLFVTGWNEWVAGSYAASSACSEKLLADCCPLGGFYFVDQYNQEFSRGIEPMKGGHTDNYYFQLVGQNRLRKGVRPVPAAGAPQTINLTGGFAQWNSVSPGYYDPANDTVFRNYASSVLQIGTYTNSTGRNDFTALKAARDANNFYLFAQCNSNITSYTGSNWMVLFIDTDQNHATGWEGYDYAVNLGGVTASTTTLCQNTTLTNGWNWTAVRSDIAYTVNGNQLMLAIPRASLGLTGDPVGFDFKWADNFQTNDIADFAVDGDTAPDRRFNYRYATTTNTEVVLLSDGFENGKQTVWAETWTNSQWNITTSSPYSGSKCVVANWGASQSNLIARVSTAGYGSLRLNFHYKLNNVNDAQNLKLYYLGTNGWTAIRKLSRDEFYPTDQAWPYDEQQDVWLNFSDTRLNTGPDAQFFSTNFAFRIDGSAVTFLKNVYVDDVRLTATTELPVPTPGWQTRDIGNAGNVGSVTTNGNTFTVTGSGLDIWNNGDSFRFVYQALAGDGTITARVASQTPAGPWSKAGVMIRESADSGARHAFTALTPGNGVSFQRRTAALGTSAFTASSGPVAPYWVRLNRAGGNFSSYASTNGTTWTLIGSVTLANFNNAALWGLAVTANNNNTNSTATFDSVTVAMVTPPLAIAAVGNQTLIAGQKLVLANTLTSHGTPPVTWSLLTSPTGMTLNSTNGILNWRPTIAQSPTTNPISFKVTDSASLSATNNFWVTVNAPNRPTIGAPAWNNGVFSMFVSGTTGPDYILQASTNLANPAAWNTVLTSNSPSLPFTFTDPNATEYDWQFYRILLGP